MSLNWGSQPSKHWRNGHIDSSYSNRLKSPSIQRSQFVFMCSTPLSKKNASDVNALKTPREVAKNKLQELMGLKIEGLRLTNTLKAQCHEPIIRFLLGKSPWFLGLWWNFCIEIHGKKPETFHVFGNGQCPYAKKTSTDFYSQDNTSIPPKKFTQPVFLNLCFFPGTLH